ncbi:MAG: aldehyde dehydrogenase family protein [Kiritimatiellia bacterium]
MTKQTSIPEASTDVAGLIARARQAQARIDFASQAEVELVTRRLAWSFVQPDFTGALARFCVQESGMGTVADKQVKLHNKVRGVFRDMKGRPSTGVVEDNREKGLLKIAKPMGVIGAVIPATNSEATPCIQSLFAMKTRNAIVMAPHPLTVQTCGMVVARARAVLQECGWPEDLILHLCHVTKDATMELMRQCDMVLATCGTPMVQAAYRSGTPAQGVGAGNAVSIVDETADLAAAAAMIARSKTFDYATSCSAENALAIQASVYDRLLQELAAVGGHLLNAAEKAKLQSVMWLDGKLNPRIVGQSPAVIAALAGLTLPPGARFLLVEETGVGDAFPFSGEKLSVTAVVYRWKSFPEALELVNRITAFSGRGHSCGIHTTCDARVRELGLQVRVSRVMVRQPQALANSGSWTNGMPMTLTLGSGSWGRNSTSANITWEHLLNYTWVAYPIPDTQPTDEELFS